MKEKGFLQTPTFKIIAFTIAYLCLGYTLAPLSSEFYQHTFHCSMMDAEMFRQYGFFGFHFLCMILGILIFRKTLKLDITRFKEKIWSNMGKIVLTFVLMLVGSMIFSFIQSDNQAAVDSLAKVGSPLSNLLFMITVGIIGPMNEELLFREVIIGQLGTKLPKWILVIVSSVLFGLIHITSLDQLPQTLPYIWNGLMLSLLYVRNKDNVLLSSGAHMLNNIIGLLM